MNLTKIIINLFLITFSVIFLSCRESSNQKINAFVSIPPQKFFVEKIGGNKVDVSVFVSPGMSPENFEPLPSQLIKLSRADLYFTIGLQFENTVINNFQSSHPSLKIINTGENINHRSVESYKDILDKSHSHKHRVDEHNHGLFDPHIWLSPALVKLQAEIIYKSLSELDPTSEDYYKNNFKNFIADIDSAAKLISSNLLNVESRDLLVFHPAWGYFCDDFNLKQIPIELEGKEPGMKDLSNMLNYIKKNRSKFILAEAQNNSPALNSIAEELNLKIIKHDPLAENYFHNLVLLSEVIKDNN